MCVVFLFWVFVFKQKTAYELRISDWSSDVCSSDLPHQEVGRFRRDILRQLCKPLGGDHACKPALSAPAHQVCHRAERGLARLVRYLDRRGGGEKLRLVDHHQHRIPFIAMGRPEESRVGKEGDSPCRSRRYKET